MQLADPGLRLPEIEDSDAVGIGFVIRRGDRLDLIGAITDVTAHDPPGAIFAFAIANMQAGIERPIIGFAAGGESKPS
jgi:hypothetical protein